jgi:hypothetical protein
MEEVVVVVRGSDCVVVMVMVGLGDSERLKATKID